MTKKSWEAGELSGISTQLRSKLQSKNGEGDWRKPQTRSQVNPQNRLFAARWKWIVFLYLFRLFTESWFTMHTAQLHDFEACPEHGARMFLCVRHKNTLLQTHINPILQNPQLIPVCLKWNPLIQFQRNACSLKKGRKTITIKGLNAVLRLNILEAYLATFTCNDTIMDSWWFVSTDLAWNNFNLSCNRSTQPVNYIFF